MGPSPTAARVAALYKQAAFFNPGDIILYGKYKNHRGRIVRFFNNPKGQPQVEIEPIPKGRKQNKVIGLFKIWSVKAIEEVQRAEQAQTAAIAQRVASRFQRG